MKRAYLSCVTILLICASCHKEHSTFDSSTKGGTAAPVNFYTNYPAPGKWATLAFEDNWPSLGDYDVNDLVVSYHYTFGRDNAGNVLNLYADITVLASGASFQNGLGIDLPIDAALVKSVTGQHVDAGYIQENSNGTEAGQTDAVIILFDNQEALLHYSDYSYFINVYPNKERVVGDTAHLVITFTKPLDRSYLAGAPFNPFLISNMRRGHEVHLAGGKPTKKADASLFNTADDNSKSGITYRSKAGYPWALNFTEGSFTYPVEKTVITSAYLHYQDWIQSGGKNYTDWYSNAQPGYRNNVNIFY